MKGEMYLKSATAFMLLILLSVNLFGQTLTTATSTLFSGSGNCQQCHTSNASTFINSTGNDISPPTMWRGSMMANSSHDPFWQAKVTAEVSANPHLKEVIEDKCATCHAPMGRTEAIYNGADHYSFDELTNDALSMDGVSCTVCHQIQDTVTAGGVGFSGGYTILDQHEIFGPFANPTQQPMFNTAAYTPMQSAHIKDSEICSTCHTLYTPYVDDEGQVAGTLPEQTPYLEWLNSIYNENGESCQSCHMEEETLAQKLTVRPNWITATHTPVMNHKFVGANVFMNNILANNVNELGLSSAKASYDSTYVYTSEMLANQTAELNVVANFQDNSIVVDAEIINKTGHKFPTGFPSRRVWLNVVAYSGSDTLFNSGRFNSNGEIINEDESYEQHYSVINDESQVQIYESVMADVNGEVTYTLLRGAEYIKDNRIPPKGFKSNHPDYNDIKVTGIGDDTDFNFANGEEGTGSDITRYNIPVFDFDGEITVSIKLLYQTISAKFVNDLFSYNTEEVETFKALYNEASNLPVLIKSVDKTISVTDIENENNDIMKDYALEQNYPNPFNPSTNIRFSVVNTGSVTLEVFNLLGERVSVLVDEVLAGGNHEVKFNADNLPGGVYLYRLQSGTYTSTKKMILLK